MELSINDALVRGVAAHRAGELQDAERLYRALLAVQSGHPDANHNLGLLLVAQRKIAEALPLFRKALQANAGVEQFWLSFIDALIKGRQIDDVGQALIDARQAGVSEEKLEAFKAQLKLALDRAEPPLSRLGLLLERYQSGEMEQAEGLARSLIEDFPEHPMAWKVLGAVMSTLARWSDAESAMREAVKLAPGDAEAHCNLGVMRQELGQVEEAEESYRKAIALRPDYAEAHFSLAAFFQAKDRLLEAEESYKNAISNQPDHVAAYVNLGAVLHKTGNFADSLIAYRKALDLGPEGVVTGDTRWGAQVTMVSSILLNMGNVLKDSQSYLDAESSYRQAIFEDSGNSNARTGLGYLLLKLGKYEEALSELKRGDGMLRLRLDAVDFCVEGG